MFEANAAQTQRALYSYEVWGNPTYALTPAGLPLTLQQQPYRFSTKWRHAASGLSYFGARWYDSTQGRWINRDPIGESGGVNLYGFVNNNPINAVDPDGQFANYIVGAAGGVATGYAIAKLTGQCYSWKNAAVDAGAGALGVGLANKAAKLWKLRGAAKAKTTADALEAGRLGGNLYDTAKLSQLSGYLGRRGIKLQVGDEFLPAGKAGGFDAVEGVLSLRSNPTQYEVWHELSHFRQFQKLGLNKYMSQSRAAKEQFVFDMLENSPKRWGGLNFEQQQHAIDYVHRVGGFR